MKKIVLLFAFFVSLSLVFGRENPVLKEPTVDKRVELLSIVFRLAGNEEYNSKQFKLYTDRIEQHFAPYKEHELIRFAKRLREENGVSYDAVMSMAINPNNIPDSRWDRDDAVKFEELMNAFCKDARCETFFNDNEVLYAETVGKFKAICKDIDAEWFKSFYGEASVDKFEVIIALGNGGNCYSPCVDTKIEEKTAYAVLGVWDMDSVGLPQFKPSEYLPMLLHEFNHSFVNSLIEINVDLFHDSGKEIFKAVEYEMNMQSYGDWQIMPPTTSL